MAVGVDVFVFVAVGVGVSVGVKVNVGVLVLVFVGVVDGSRVMVDVRDGWILSGCVDVTVAFDFSGTWLINEHARLRNPTIMKIMIEKVKKRFV